MSIKKTVKSVDPDATIILYGSYARGEEKQDSDLDILILVDRDNLTREDQKQLKYQLYDIEFDTGQIISPLVLSRND